MKSPWNITIFTESIGQQSIVFIKLVHILAELIKNFLLECLTYVRKKGFAILKASVKIKLSFKGQKIEKF